MKNFIVQLQHTLWGHCYFSNQIVLGPTIYLISAEWSLLFAGLIAGTVAFLIGEKMTSNEFIILAIVATSVATYISRLLGVLNDNFKECKCKV